MGNKRLSYTASFKLQIVQYEEKHSKRPAGRKFDVNEQCVTECCKKKKMLENAQKSKQAIRSKQSAFPQTEDKLYAYVMDLRKSSYAVSTEKLQMKASKIA
jgi:hypothetical protein